MKRINSNDIARLAGVSRSTVSRVINGYSNVPDETREKVMKVIKEHHYYPQLSGQLLTGMTTKTIGLFWFGPSTFTRDPLTSSYFMHIIDAATQRGYLVLSCVLENLTDKKNVNYVRKIFMEGRIDAGIFVGVNNNEPLIDELVDADKIVGLFDYFHENEDKPNKLSVNFNPASAEQTVDYLYSLGHRKIAVIDGDFTRRSCVQRHESYLRGMMKHNLPIKNKWQAYGGIYQSTGYRAAKEMLSACMDDLPTAICANNDPVAFGVYKACAELGLRIPEDISVVGNDGHPNSRHAVPPLTTSEFNFREMFFSLTNRVIDTIEEKENVPLTEFIPSAFVERASCKTIEN